MSAGWMRRGHKGQADTGIAFQVVFGNGWGFVEIDQPEKYKDQERIMEYERQLPKKQEE